MIIEPKIRNNICLNAHPEGCKDQVESQIAYVKSQGSMEGVKRVLVIGSSNGYGLASRIVTVFGCGAASIGVSYERPATESKTASSGWYNEAAFRKAAERESHPAWSINGDAFSEEVKEEVLGLIREQLGQVDMVVYSIAAPRRKDPTTGILYSSVIKPIGKAFVSKTVDFQSGQVSEIRAEPASEEEIEHTVKVMGGEDWLLWIKRLVEARLLADGALTVAYSYIGPDITYPIYRDGTIGRAKEHLEESAAAINTLVGAHGGKAYVSVNKALVTRASAVIPAVPLYISLLYKVMKRKGIHEDCIEQMERLFKGMLCSGPPIATDSHGRIRLDDLEMREEVQREVHDLWHKVDTENLEELSDIEGFRTEFLQHHGFAMPGVDYSKDVDPRML
jgi:enoyl-[acyl-carrier protein] reductase/trans-2-enoyl-CoA reductase (NAD+)